MRDQAGGAEEIEDERDVVEPADRDPQPQPERADDVDAPRMEPVIQPSVTRCTVPATAGWRNVIVVARLARGGDHREEQRDVRSHEVGERDDHESKGRFVAKRTGKGQRP